MILLGGMAYLRVPLNTITLVSLLLAMALAIDYACHIGASMCWRPPPSAPPHTFPGGVFGTPSRQVTRT